MTDYRYERLSALDNSFLVLETAETPMHVGSAGIFEAGPLTRPDGGIDIDRIVAHIASCLHRIPRYRERLAYVPIEGHPVWVDDDRFNLNYHVRHTALPKPGDERQLKRLCARILSQQLDRGKPLWETWIVEGLEGGRFAMISKVHHCMIDGISGVDLLTIVLSPGPDAAVAPPRRWIPRPAPGQLELLRDEIGKRMRAPLALAAGALRRPGEAITAVRNGAAALGEALRTGLRLASDTPLNQPIGPHRRFDWAAVDLTAVQEIKDRHGGTANDVVLATVAGAARRFLQGRGVSPQGLEFRAFVPVSLRAPTEHGTLGNRVAGWIVDLPVGEADPARRLAAVHEATAHLKVSGQARGTEMLTEMSDWTGSTVLTMGMRLASRARPFNLVVTNVPGPPVPLYLLGARLLAAYPMVPLFVNLGLGIALFSNAGKLFWGFNADWDVLPDLHDFVSAVEKSFAELQAAPAPPSAVKAPRRAAARARPRSRRAG